MSDTITVVGGGIGGLVAAIEAAERGARVRLHEAAPVLGGRARTSTGAFRANHGPHVVYDDGLLWAWLAERGLARPAARLPLASPRILVGGRSRRLPPRGVVAALVRRRRADAPVDVDARAWFRSWTDEATAEQLCAAAGVATFHHDPGILSAAFVWERLVRATGLPPAVRYVPGGWATLADRLAARARDLGVIIELGSRLDRVPDGPTMVAVPLRAASRLLRDDRLVRAPGSGTRTALLDVGVRRRRGDPFLVSDLDGGGWLERFSAADRSLAPAGHDLVQVQVGVDHDDLDAGVATCERVLDAT
jgi:phytoene dehydrogenase-like protein